MEEKATDDIIKKVINCCYMTSTQGLIVARGIISCGYLLKTNKIVFIFVHFFYKELSCLRIAFASYRQCK